MSNMLHFTTAHFYRWLNITAFNAAYKYNKDCSLKREQSLKLDLLGILFLIHKPNFSLHVLLRRPGSIIHTIAQTYYRQYLLILPQP